MLGAMAAYAGHTRDSPRVPLQVFHFDCSKGLTVQAALLTPQSLLLYLVHILTSIDWWSAVL